MWALRFSLLYAILRMNPDLVPANGTLEFPKPWNQSAVLFLFCAPAGLQVRQLRRRVRVHLFLKKDFSGSGYFPQLGNFHLGCCYSHFHMLYYEGTLDGLQQTGRLSSLSGGAILGFVFCFAGDFASARLTFL